MGANTQIEWTEATWNPVNGCTKVSPGCAHCYAERLTLQRGGKPFLPGKAEIKLHPERVLQPLHWHKPRMIFTCSMADLFHEEVPFEFIEAIWVSMACCDGKPGPGGRYSGPHTFQVLTKRPERMHQFLTEHWNKPWLPNPLTNVWLGVSVENQRMVEKRIPVLLETPAAVHFVSCEPLLAPLNLRPYLIEGNYKPLLDWVIVGGESGPRARPMAVEWVRRIRDQCQAAGVPFFFKQWGGWPNKRGGDQAVLDGHLYHQMPSGRLFTRRIGHMQREVANEMVSSIQ